MDGIGPIAETVDGFSKEVDSVAGKEATLMQSAGEETVKVLDVPTTLLL